jgi:hypothetical protein
VRPGRLEEGADIVQASGHRRVLRSEHQFAEGEFEAEAHAAGLTVVLHVRGDVGTAVLMAHA